MSLRTVPRLPNAVIDGKLIPPPHENGPIRVRFHGEVVLIAGVKSIAVNRNPGERDSAWDPDGRRLAGFRRLWAEADDLWERHQNTSAFQGYVSADYQAVYDSLVQLRGKVWTVLEWGSGLGVVTIMASCMGFEAYGIEAEQVLVEYSERLAQAHGPGARFAQGSFIPSGFEWIPAHGDHVSRTIVDAVPAYDELDMELRDFDLVYAYPWPDEHTLYHNIMREFGLRNAMFLSYDAREGMQLVRFNHR